jgi:translation initiation factor 6
MDKQVALMDFEGNANIGIYFFANDKFALLGKDLPEKKLKDIEKTLGVPVYPLKILETEFIGIFLSGNNEILLAPELYDYERVKLNEICEKHEVKLLELKEKRNTLGNNICVGEKEILLNSEYPQVFIKELEKATKLKALTINNEEFKAMGSVMTFINGSYFISQEFTEKEVEKILDKIAGIGTVNQGSNMIASGVVGNKNGIILGSQCSSVEIQNIIESLEFL